MEHLGVNTYNTGDEWPAGGINIVTHTPISGSTGWNLIGGYESNVLTSGITTTPAGLQTGSVFGYSSGYTPATNLVPGYGYWINKVNRCRGYKYSKCINKRFSKIHRIYKR